MQDRKTCSACDALLLQHSTCCTNPAADVALSGPFCSGLDSQLPPPNPSVGSKRKLTITAADLQQRSKRQKLLLEKRKERERVAGKAHRLRTAADG
jgi:hypothetical protein